MIANHKKEFAALEANLDDEEVREFEVLRKDIAEKAKQEMLEKKQINSSLLLEKGKATVLFLKFNFGIKSFRFETKRS